jgi:DNA/RNA endonuclease YhcR with UshA esterase domain
MFAASVLAADVIPVIERERIEASLDQEITVEGRIERFGESKTRSILFLNFEGLERGGFTLIIRQGTLAGDYEQHDPAFAPSFVGKNVRVTGTVTTYKGGFQMQVFAPSQIEVLPEAAAES